MLCMTMLMSMMLTASISFIFLKHPLSMGLMLLIQTILLALITGFMSINFWFSYIIFLVMIGGMLVLLIYMTSIASNEKFKFSYKMSMIIYLLIILMMMINNDNYFINLLNLYLKSINDQILFYLNFMNYLTIPSMIMNFFMIIYLFITLIAIVKITNINQGPLRQKF